MAESVLQLTLTARNLVSKELEAIRADVRALNTELDKISSTKGIDAAAEAIEDLGDAAQGAAQEVEEVADSLDDVQREGQKVSRLKNAFKSVGSGLRTLRDRARDAREEFSRLNDTPLGALKTGLAGLFTGAAVKGLADAGAELEQSIGAIASIVPDAERSVEQLKEDVLSLSDAYGGDVADNARALYNIISSGGKAGADANQLFAESFKLGRAGMSDTATAADLLTTVINSYGYAAEDASRVSDSLFLAVQDGKTEVDELARSFGQVAPIAATAKVSLQEVNAAIAVLTGSGVKTESAISGMRAAIAGILQPNEMLVTAFKEAGYESAQAAIAQDGFQKAIEVVAKSANGNIGTLQKMVGSIEAVNIILGLTGDNSAKFTTALKRQADALGVTQAAFDEVSGSSGQRYRDALDSIGNSMKEIGTGATAVLAPVYEVLAEILSGIVAWGRENPKLAATIGVVASAVAGLLVTIGTLSVALPILRAGFVALGGPAVIAALTAVGAFLKGFISELQVLSAQAGVAQGRLGALAMMASRLNFAVAIAASVYTLYQLADAAWDAYEATSALDKQQKLAQGRADRYAEEVRGIDRTIKAKEELLRLSDAEIDAYQERLLALQKEAAARKVAEMFKGDDGNAAVIAEATRQEEAYAAAIAESAAEETRRKAPVEESAKAIEKVKTAFVETTAAAEAFAFRAQGLNQLNFDQTVDALTRVRDANIAAFTLAGNEEGILQAQRTFDQRRLQVQSEFTNRSLQIVNTTLQRKIAALYTEETDAEKRQAKITELERSAAQQRVQIVQNEMSQVRQARDAAMASYKSSLENIASLNQRIADIRMQGEFQIADIYRSAMSDSAAYHSRAREQAAMTAKIQEAIAQGEYERAEALAQRQLQLAASLNQEVKDGELVVISKEKAAQNAVGATRKANENLISVLEARKKKEQEEAAAQKATYEQLNASLDTLSNRLERITQGTETKVKLIADDSDLQSEFTRVQQTETSTTIFFAPDTTAAEAARIIQANPIIVPVIYQPQGAVPGRANGGLIGGYATGGLLGSKLPRFAVGGSLAKARAQRTNGYMRGKGTGTSDSILFLGSNGEYVLKARAVRKYGLNTLNAMNRMAIPRPDLPRRATGGLLGSRGIAGPASSSAGGSRDTVDLNLNLNGRELGTLTGPRDTVQGLVDMLQELNRGTV
jgi:TP901 family phage tail tape measure protein